MFLQRLISALIPCRSRRHFRAGFDEPRKRTEHVRWNRDRSSETQARRLLHLNASALQSGFVDRVLCEYDATGVVCSGECVGFQAALRAADSLAHSRPELRVGVYCPDLRPQDIMCRVSSAIQLVLGLVPTAPRELADMLVSLRALRRGGRWGGTLIGLYRTLPDTATAFEQLRRLRDSGTVDALGCELSHLPEHRDENRLAAFLAAAWPLATACVSAGQRTPTSVRWQIERISAPPGATQPARGDSSRARSMER